MTQLTQTDISKSLDLHDSMTFVAGQSSIAASFKAPTAPAKQLSMRQSVELSLSVCVCDEKLFGDHSRGDQ